jgi:ribosomal protein S18 acetylase RimI-like enzyme
MLITNSTPEDFNAILRMYDEAIAYQKAKLQLHWHSFDHALLAKEIKEGMHWKIVTDQGIACVFSSAYNDALVWDDKDNVPSLYLHRIVTNPLFRGKGFVKQIITWAKEYARSKGKIFVRLDVFKDNQKLNEYYRACGLMLCGEKYFNLDNGIPKHYQGIILNLYEMKIEDK